MQRKSPVLDALLLYVGYLILFFATWIVNGIDYTRIGESAQTTKLWYALPTLFGSAGLVVAISMMGWWRTVLFDRTHCTVRWIWILPVVMFLIILNNFLNVNTQALSGELLLWSLLGAVGVGFGEEMITRGSMVAGLRSRFTEGKVWLLSTLLFSALHIPNVYFGFPWEAMAVQLVLTFILGSGLYALRRMSGTLILPMVLHGLWDSALFMQIATGAEPNPIQFAVYPVAIACASGVLLRDRKNGPSLANLTRAPE